MSTLLGNLHPFNLHLNLCFSGGVRPGAPPGSSAEHLTYSGVTWDGLAHFDRGGYKLRNQCFVIVPRRGESIKITIWAKTPSCPLNGYEFQCLSFPTTLQSLCCLLCDPLSPSCWVSQVVLVVKSLPANAGVIRTVGSIPGSGRSPEESMATHSSILAWKIPWMEEPGGLQSIGSQRVKYNWSNLACMHSLLLDGGTFPVTSLWPRHTSITALLW